MTLKYNIYEFCLGPIVLKIFLTRLYKCDILIKTYNPIGALTYAFLYPISYLSMGGGYKKRVKRESGICQAIKRCF